jgi:hypothetical protein
MPEKPLYSYVVLRYEFVLLGGLEDWDAAKLILSRRDNTD